MANLEGTIRALSRINDPGLFGNGTEESATATNLGARIKLWGTMLRWAGDYTVPIWVHGQESDTPKVTLHPGDTAQFNVVIGHLGDKKFLLPATAENQKPYSLDSIHMFGMSDPLYIARITFRGRGVNQKMWFSIWNWNFPNDYPVSIHGPLSLWKRTKPGLHLLGIKKKWRPYRPYKPTAEDQTRADSFKKSLDEITAKVPSALGKAPSDK